MLNADLENAWRFCFQELSHFTRFRCALLVQLQDTPDATLMPICLTWVEDAFIEPFQQTLQQPVWLNWMRCSQFRVLSGLRLPKLEFEEALGWSVQHLILLPLHSLSGCALGGLLLLHDDELVNQDEFLHLATPVIRYAALLLEYACFQNQQALPLNTLRSELDALQADTILTKKNAVLLSRLQNALEQLSGLSLDSLRPMPLLPCVQKNHFHLQQLLEQFVAEQLLPEKKPLHLHFNADIPFPLEGDERIVRQLLLNLYQQANDVYPHALDFKLSVLRLENDSPALSLKFSIYPSDDHPRFHALRGNAMLLSDVQGMLRQRAEVAALLCQLLQGQSSLLANSAGDNLWFSIHLQRHSTTDYQLQQETAALLEDNTPAISADAKAFRILVAEDSPINQTVIQKMLNRLGYPCELVDNGLKVLEAWEAGDYQLILMDCEMPELDGYDAAAEIRKREHRRGGRIPIVALTAHALAEHRERSRAVGMDEHLSKPISLPVLRETLNYWEQRSQPVAANEKPKQTATPEMETDNDAAAVFDAKIFSDLKQVLGDKFATILQQFLEYAPQQLKQLQKAKIQQDCEGLRRKAHQFKGEAAQIGAIELSRLCKELEMLARSGNVNMANELLQRIDTEVKRVIVSLHRELKT